MQIERLLTPGNHICPDAVCRFVAGQPVTLMAMSSSDRGYAILLTHLHNTSSKLPLSTIKGALAHHLATVLLLPTPLAAAAILLPLYLSQPFTNEKLQSFSTAFKHATHLKYRALVDAVNSRSTLSTLLGRSMQAVIGEWVSVRHPWRPPGLEACVL